MAIVDLVLPKMGESIMEATILKWCKAVGETIKTDEVILEVATDKVDSEVLATNTGTVVEILFNENDVVPVGSVLARIETESAADENQKPLIQSQEKEPENVPLPSPEIAESVIENKQNTVFGNRFYSPLVLKIATENCIGLGELEHLPGSGTDGRVTKKDLLEYIESQKSKIKSQTPVISNQPNNKQPIISNKQQETISQQPATDYGSNVEIIEMDRMRKLIAKHMVSSKQTSPHVSSFVECDVTNMVLWREKAKIVLEQSEHLKLTFTPMFVSCLARVIKRYPLINCSVEGDNIILKKDINIGMATALPNGNLIVPVIKNAQYLNLIGLAKNVNDLAEKARAGRLKPDDTQGGTFTMTNIGTFGNLMGTPIINQPQVAILAVGAIKKRPVVVETKDGDKIEIRHMMYLSLSYDHRVVDGSTGAAFLSALATEFEKWDLNRDVL